MAARDADGGIRMDSGRGVGIANATHARADVQGWLDRAEAGSPWHRQYVAALRLIDSEA